MAYSHLIIVANQRDDSQKMMPRWWFGGIAGCITQAIIAPIDLVETRMQALHHELGTIETFKLTVAKEGFFALYDGLTAQFVRQVTYTTLRFHLYGVGKRYVNKDDFTHKVFVAALSGVLAGVVGVPTEVVHTRMQVDGALPLKIQRRYRNVFDALIRIYMTEGFLALYNGGIYSCTRAALMTIGQNAFYDEANNWYRKNLKLDRDSMKLTLLSSVTAGFLCAPWTQPLDVLRTINMQYNDGYFKSWLHEIRYVLRFGISGLFRGFVPCLLRIVPATVVLFITYEELCNRFGYYPEPKNAV